LRKKLGEAGRLHVLQHCTVAAEAAGHLQLYRDVIGLP